MNNLLEFNSSVPVMETVRAGAWAVPAFVRTYPCQTAAAAAVYAAAAAVSLLVLPDPLVGPFAGGRIGTWLVGLLAMVPMAPIWTSLYRFVILGDTCRHYWPPDRRSLRVLVAQVILSAITATGALPFAVFVDFWPRLTIGTRWIAALLAGLSALRLLALWLSLRLAIAPHVGAAGKSRPFLESSFVYSGGAVLRMFAARVLVYLPLMVLSGVLILAIPLMGLRPALLAHPATVAVTAAVTAVSDLVDGATFSFMARQLAAGGPPVPARRRTGMFRRWSV